MVTEFNDNYKIVRSIWIDNMLENLPDVKIGKSKGFTIAREYKDSKDGKRTHYNYYPNSKGYKTAIENAIKRKELLSERKTLPKVNGRIVKCGRINMTNEKWESLIESANSKEFYGDYYVNGIRLRSRFELIVANALTSLKLQFKYEVALELNGETVYPDFLVFLPELEICFIIECLGMLDNPDYVYRNTSKLINYFAEKLIVDRDLLIFCGGKDFLPDSAYIRNQIIRHINGLMDESLQILH